MANGFTDRLGNKVTEGDRVAYEPGGRTGRLVACFHDGDAYVEWDDEEVHGTTGPAVRWYYCVLLRR